MASLKDVHKAFIVERFACFGTLDEIATALKETFDLDVHKSTIHRYDPTTAQGQAELDARWKTLFQGRRERFLKEVSAIPIANQAVRLKELQGLFDQNRGKGIKTAQAILEQAAREVGGLYARTAEKSPGEGGQAEAMFNAFQSAIDKIYGDKPAAPGVVPASVEGTRGDPSPPSA